MISESELLKQQGASFWDSNPCGGNWRNYHEYMTWIQETEPYIYEILRKYTWDEHRVLEVGCGQGSTLNFLPQFGASMMGVDMSPESLLRAKAGADELGQTDRVKVSLSDAEQLPFSSESFDRVISVGVLHHTEDTAGAVRELYRVLKPGGTAIVMLYRSGNPKWWATWALRRYSAFVDRRTGTPNTLAARLRSNQAENTSAGTALLELFGVPILKTFSNQQARRMFADFREVRITNFQPGFLRLKDLLPLMKPLSPVLTSIDKVMQARWGFYQVIEANKQS